MRQTPPALVLITASGRQPGRRSGPWISGYSPISHRHGRDRRCASTVASARPLSISHGRCESGA
jgi:hypothetical protein